MAVKFNFKKTHNNLYEKQKFSNIYVLLILLSVEVSCLYYLALKVVAHKPFIFSTFIHWPLLIFTLLVPTLLLIIYNVIKLETIFNDDGIFFRWMPFKSRYSMIQWDAIREITLIDLKNKGSYWKFKKEYDKVDYMGGKIGLHILMKNGKKRLISTKKAEALNRILIRLAGKNYIESSVGERTDYKDD